MSTGCIIAIVVVAGAVPLLGVFATLAIYGVRRYIATAKTAEARNTIGAITRAAVSSYESDHVLCASARPVPVTVPKATKYMPSTVAGNDFNSGDDHLGWKCLRFSMTQPIYYQYQYHAGSGLPDAGRRLDRAEGLRGRGDRRPQRRRRSEPLRADGARRRVGIARRVDRDLHRQRVRITFAHSATSGARLGRRSATFDRPRSCERRVASSCSPPP